MMFLKTLPCSRKSKCKILPLVPCTAMDEISCSFQNVFFLGTDHKRYINYENKSNCLKCKG